MDDTCSDHATSRILYQLSKTPITGGNRELNSGPSANLQQCCLPVTTILLTQSRNHTSRLLPLPHLILVSFFLCIKIAVRYFKRRLQELNLRVKYHNGLVIRHLNHSVKSSNPLLEKVEQKPKNIF